MLTFAVFEENAPSYVRSGSGGWPLRHAHLFGPDDVPVQAEVRCAGGIIRCEKRGTESAGICLQYPLDAPDLGGLPGAFPSSGSLATGGAGEGGATDAGSPGSDGGVVTLQTCLLPEREQPYLLSLELARHRLMLVLNKLEDWALFDLPADDGRMQLFERARRAFTEALVAHATDAARNGGENPYTAESDRLARRALSLAVEASEAITLHQARAQFGKRMSGELAAAAARIGTPANALTDHEAAESRNALIGSVGVILPSPPQVGAVVSPESFTPQLCKAVSLGCDFMTIPMRWVEMEPTEGKYLFAKTDKWIEWAVRSAKVPLVGGPIVDFRRGSVPEWLYIWEHDYETLRELVYEHVKNIVTRYRRTIGTWTVCSGLHVNSNFTFSLEQVMDLTRLVVMVVRKLQPSGKIQVQIDQPWGEYYAYSPRAVPPMMYAEMIGQAGINPDLFSIRVEMGQPEPGRSTRDLMAFSAMLDRFAALDKPLSIGAVCVPAAPAPGTDAEVGSQMEPGYWRKPWSPESQAAWMTGIMGIAVSKPYVHSVCWDELYEPPARPGTNDPESHHHALLDRSGTPRPAFWRLAEIRQAIRAKSSPLLLAGTPNAGSLA